MLGAVYVFISLAIKGEDSLQNMLFISLLTLLIIVVLSVVHLPFTLKYGTDKGRLIMLITYFFLFLLVTLIKEKVGAIIGLIDIFNQYSMNMIGISILLIGLVVIGICLKISIAVMEKKSIK